MVNSDDDPDLQQLQLDTSPIPLLQKIKTEGRVWGDLAQQYGVTNPDPPWKANVEGICDALAEENCALPALERRWEEDELSETLFSDMPFPERQLLSLAHSMIKRGLFNEEELQSRMKVVEHRLNA